MVQMTMKSRVWTIFQRQSIVPSPIRRKDHGANVIFLGPIDHGQLDQEKTGQDHLQKYLVQSRRKDHGPNVTFLGP
jgi:hypothetical protein